MQPIHAVDQSSSMGKLVATALGFGVFHVLSGPDHLSALATLSAGSSWRSFALGVRWGCGHSIGLIIMALIFILLDDSLNLEKLDIVTEVVVGVFMIALGVYGIYSAHKKFHDPDHQGHAHGGTPSTCTCKQRPYEEVPCRLSSTGRSSDASDLPSASSPPTDPSSEQSLSPSVVKSSQTNLIPAVQVDDASVSAFNDNSEVSDADSLEIASSTTSSHIQRDDDDSASGDDGSGDDDNVPLAKGRSNAHDYHRRWRRCVPRVNMDNPTTQKATALIVGIIHGIAGPGGILGVMPAVRYHNWLRSMVYLGTFCLTSIIIMGLFAALYGELTSRLGYVMTCCCVGTQSDEAGKASGCAGCPNQSLCASGATKLPDPTVATVKDHLSRVKHKILVLSGKGGVGKSTISCQLAFGLAQKGFQVGLLDVDITGPSVPRMLGLQGQEVHQSNEGWSPVYVDDNLGVMSIGFMLPNADDAIIWRGPKKSGLIKQFLTDVHWGDLDYLIIDTPPGTSDEHISIVQYLKDAQIDGAVVVTTPQEVAMADVRKELNFCKKTNVPILGYGTHPLPQPILPCILHNLSNVISMLFRVVENMAGLQQHLARCNFVDPVTSVDQTQHVLDVLRAKAPELLSLAVHLQVFPPAAGGGEAMAHAFNVPFLGRLPLDQKLTQACEEGVSFLEAYPTSSAASAFKQILDQVVLNAAKK
ncbi:hypothetical protein DYB35_008914 [Aphanomyces astaci]|uniref:Cytosolic Fe-S cluster assembly factor NUBP1 homolog n=1 Tax=Aphanomyces astaci TaxID=112090 RepID=A0A3R6ZZG4_APHAT|nr:hypothetical protein DYB35_008914 [Aphanomyces astaci]